MNVENTQIADTVKLLRQRQWKDTTVGSLSTEKNKLLFDDEMMCMHIKLRSYTLNEVWGEEGVSARVILRDKLREVFLPFWSRTMGSDLWNSFVWLKDEVDFSWQVPTSLFIFCVSLFCKLCLISRHESHGRNGYIYMQLFDCDIMRDIRMYLSWWRFFRCQIPNECFSRHHDSYDFLTIAGGSCRCFLTLKKSINWTNLLDSPRLPRGP